MESSLATADRAASSVELDTDQLRVLHIVFEDVGVMEDVDLHGASLM
jgi:hypothetical protein